jgi:hypothetical protein
MATAKGRQDLDIKKQSHAGLIGQQIAPWPVLIATVSPAKVNKPALADLKKSTSPTSTFEPRHRRTLTPAREPEPEPTFQPLKPARTKAPLHDTTLHDNKSNPKLTVES